MKLSSFHPLVYYVILVLIVAAVLRFWGLYNFDISPDEYHFTQDAYRFYTGDPFTVPRHHSFRHGVPFVGHPFLAQDLMLIAFNLFGPSVWAGRAVMAAANLVALLGTYVLGRMLFGSGIGLTALILLTFLPHDVRYARDAHLDPLLGAALVWATICFWKVLHNKAAHLGAWLGIISALVWTAKINGPFLFIFYTLATIFHTKTLGLILWMREHIRQMILAGIFFVLVFVLLVSPKAYLDALVNPADPEIVGLQKVILPFFTAGPQMIWHLITTLYSIPFAILVVAGLALILKRRNSRDLFLLSVLIAYAHIFITHVGHSGEYGYITLNPYFALLAGLAIGILPSKVRLIGVVLTVVLFLPITILHGLRMDIGPWTQFSRFNDSNFRYGQTPYKDAIAAINRLPGNPVVLWIKDGTRHIPMMDVRGNVRIWPFFELSSVDTVLLADPLKLSELILNGEFNVYKEFDYKEDKVWILRRVSVKE